MARSSPLEVVVRGHMAAMRRCLPQALKGDVEALHQARVSTRRLREVLNLTRDDRKSDRSVRRDVRRLTRALGPVRELDVALGNLHELGHDRRAPRAVVALLEHLIAAEREVKQRRVRKAVAACDLLKLQARVERIVRRAGHLSVRKQARLRDGARQHVARRSHRLQVKVERAGDAYSPLRLHEVRIAVKKLRYTLEAVSVITGSRPSAALTRLTRAQDVLGRMHDFQVLMARGLDLQASGAEAVSGRQVNFDQFLARLDSECRRLHARYIGVRKGLLAVCARIELAARREGVRGDA